MTVEELVKQLLALVETDPAVAQMPVMTHAPRWGEAVLEEVFDVSVDDDLARKPSRQFVHLVTQ